ncbi:MAG: dTMP kinase, partial [Candidatus Omnitrophota bacterium]|nr:dTMP kinase [Candidatus Omnitrophota bacterium]
RLGKFATGGIAPDLTLLFDIETRKGLRRKGKVKDRIELRSVPYHTRVRRGYLALARHEPGRVKVICAEGSREEIFKKVKAYIDRLLDS